ncbi:uncharacterized protein SRS1_13281 [Sporisorium reilianum f. sp. reilianum]|uniref:Zn(2)-C6 fungal-type domain-containing protein n=1 Tax=Sporisorium reilianum f. sp. reilianum TaxID=72559 RepID=A0A2N8UCI7_9BASI|nr:uncharacterized protein SRS1_13281 [Sporisorium reilianum f. sp. reilianum]
MPDQDGSSPEARANAMSSGAIRPVDTTQHVSGPSVAHHHRDSNAAGTTPTHDSAESHDDTSDAIARASKSKPSDTLRRSQACLACRKRKLRCDAKKPTCTRCEKAWLAYHPAADADVSTSVGPPPCEYDTSLLAKIFKTTSPDPGPHASSSSAVATRPRDAGEGAQSEQLLEENEQLRARILFLQDRLRQADSVAGAAASRDGSGTERRAELQQAGSSTVNSSKLYIHSIAGEARGDAPPQKRLKAFNDSSVGRDARRLSLDASVLASWPTAASRDTSASSASLHTHARSAEASVHPRAPALVPSVLNWTSSVSGPGPAPTGWAAPTHYGNTPSPRSPRLPIAPFNTVSPPLPGRQVLDRLIGACCHDSWLFAAINGHALRDVAALLETAPNVENDHLVAQALMLACVATGLPLLSSASSKGARSSSIFTSIDDLLRAHVQADLASLDSPAWTSMVTRLYADAARELLNQAQAKSGGFITPATLVVRILLVELSFAQSTLYIAQADLSAAACDARLLHLHNNVPGAHPRLSAGQARTSHLARALRGLMQSKEETLAFWSLFLHDCFQNRSALLPVTIERQSIRIAFPRLTDGDAGSLIRRDLDEVEAYLKRRRGLPLLEPLDNAMSLLVKASLVLDECCEYNLAVCQQKASLDTSPSAREVRDQAFVTGHESIRNSRMMLTQYDDRTITRSGKMSGGGGASSGSRTRESLVQALLVQDKLRFTAELTHHMAVLSLFETEIDIAIPPTQAGGEARGMISNAAVWLSRLAGMALQNASLLYGLPAFCASALFVAARWLLFLQAADPERLRGDISTLVLALSKRGERYSRDETYAKAVVALKREAEFYGRICISPFTWPIEAISEFIPRSAPVQGGKQRGPAAPQPVEPGFVSIATLAASVDEAAVLELANAP